MSFIDDVEVAPPPVPDEDGPVSPGYVVSQTGGLGRAPGAQQFPGGLTPINREPSPRTWDEIQERLSLTRPPGAGETISAAFQQENDILAGIDILSRPDYEPDPDHNPFDVIEGTRFEGYLDNFVGSRSERETRDIMGRIEREERRRETLHRAGVAGFLASVSAGVMSPTILIPFGGWLKAMKVATTASRTMRSAKVATGLGGVAGVSSLAAEGVLYSAQETRTPEEVFWGVFGSIAPGGRVKL